MASIFLSHNSKDKRFVRRLGKCLFENGVKVWIDEAEIKVGESLINKISKGIKDMEFLGVILTPNSISSNWVQKELDIAITLEINNRKIKVLPILYKDCEIPIFLKDKVYADFRNKKMFQHSLIKLLDVLLPEGFKFHILSAVNNAIHAEFLAYRSLPKIDLDEIDKYFTENSSARSRIIHLLDRHNKKGWIINNKLNPSTYELLNINLKKINADLATVITEEYWYLRWFDINKGDYTFIYNEKNSQVYILKRGKQGIWQVDVNIYPDPKHVGR